MVYAMALCMPFCPPLCVSQVGVLSKLLNISHKLPQYPMEYSFFDAKDLDEIPVGGHPNWAVKYVRGKKNWQDVQHILIVIIKLCHKHILCYMMVS